MYALVELFKKKLDVINPNSEKYWHQKHYPRTELTPLEDLEYLEKLQKSIEKASLLDDLANAWNVIGGYGFERTIFYAYALGIEYKTTFMFIKNMLLEACIYEKDVINKDTLNHD